MSNSPLHVVQDNPFSEDVATSGSHEELRRKGRCPNTFWESTERLGYIREAARALLVSPEALLMNAASRMMAFLPPHVEFRSTEGLRNVSGNHGLINVALPGSGKSKLVDMAEVLVPSPEEQFNERGHADWVVTGGLGTGEGLLDKYSTTLSPKEEGEPPERITLATRVLNIEDELEAMLAKMQQSSNTLSSTLSTMLQGGFREIVNAELKRCRVVHKGAYRLVFVANAQPSRLMELLRTKDQGLAQRFLYVNAYSENSVNTGSIDVLSMPDEELEAYVQRKEHHVRSNPLVALKSHDGKPLAQWVQDMKPQELELPRAGHAYLWALSERTACNGVDNVLNVHKPLQMIVLCHLMNLLHGQTQPSREMWNLAVMLWDALEEGREAFREWSIQQEAKIQERMNRRYVQRQFIAKRELEQGVPTGLVRKHMLTLTNKVRREGSVTRKKLRDALNSKMKGELKGEGWTTGAAINRLLAEGILVEDDDGLILMGREG